MDAFKRYKINKIINKNQSMKDFRNIVLYAILFLLAVFGVLFLGQWGYTALSGQPQPIVINSDGNLGQAGVPGRTILAGAATNLVSLPPTFSNSNSTTTDSALLDGGATITQAIETTGNNVVRLDLMVKAGTATSTLFIKPQFSYDNSNFFTASASSTPIINYVPQARDTGTSATSTFVWTPPTATSTQSLLYRVSGAKYMRFVIRTEDVDTDPDDGVQAFIQAVVLDEFN